MQLSLPIRNQRGIALLYLVIMFMLLGVLVSAGVRKFGSTVTLAKTKDTKAELERDVQMITAWAAKKERMPFTTATPATNEYLLLFGANPQDAWGRPVIYLYDNNLADTTKGGLCGRTSTAITINSGQNVPNVAFLLLSGGENSPLQSTMTGTGTWNTVALPSPITSGAITTGAVTVNVINDIVRYVTLAELKAQAGCDASTQGSLRILNNELPNACAGSLSYPGTLFPGGGVLTTGYAWSLPTPWNLQIGATTGILSPASRITTTPGSYNVTAQLSDTFSSVQRTYPVKVTILGACATACGADSGCYDLCRSDTACHDACNADASCRTTACPYCVNPPP